MSLNIFKNQYVICKDNGNYLRGRVETVARNGHISVVANGVTKSWSDWHCISEFKLNEEVLCKNKNDKP